MLIAKKHAISAKGFIRKKIVALGAHSTMGWDMSKKNVRKKTLKVGAFSTIFLDILLDDINAILAQLNMIYEPNHDISSHVKVPRRKMPIIVPTDGTCNA
jgi:hypothetical protein